MARHPIAALGLFGLILGMARHAESGRRWLYVCAGGCRAGRVFLGFGGGFGFSYFSKFKGKKSTSKARRGARLAAYVQI